MSKERHRRLAVSIRVATVALAVAIAMLGAFSTTGRAQAAGYCQCTTYTQQHFGLSNDYPNAANWGDYNSSWNNSYLGKNGWYQDSGVNVGDIVVWQKPYQGYVSYTNGGSTFAYWIANSSAGHVGYIAAMQIRNTVPRSYSVEIQSANSGLTSHYYTDGNCTDVADYWWVIGGSNPGTWQLWR